MKRKPRPDPAKELLVEQALKLTPSERFRYAMGLAAFALRANPRLMENRQLLLTSKKHHHQASH